jgi:gamma-glutamyl-gamma-aminobutyrate hydrolase PuuD
MINYYFTKNEIKDKEILKNENLLRIKDHFNGKVTHKEVGKKLSQFFTLHKVKLDKKSKLAKILHKTEIDVNSSHNYTLNKIGKKVLLYGVSPND